MIDEKEIEKNYLSMKETALVLGVSVSRISSRISRLCIQGRFHGAIKAGWSWLIPKTSALSFEKLSRGKKKTKKYT